MPENHAKLLKELYGHSREVTLIRTCQSVLEWDERTYMPRNASEYRANQMAYLAGLAHEKFTSPRIGELLNELTSSGPELDDDTFDSANVREIKRAYDKAVKVPKSLVEELSRVTTMAQGVWQEAREKSDFPIFKPWMEKVFHLKRQQAKAVGYKTVPYDAMLDDFEPGSSVTMVSAIFAALRDELVGLITRIRESGVNPDRSIITRDYPVEKQQDFGTQVATAIGYDFSSGRLDVTAHPFCIDLGPKDIRITTRYNRSFFPQAFFGILHETGHGLYDQGLPGMHHGTPCGEPASLGIHESQSRMWENFVGRSRSFWQYFFPKAQEIFPGALANAKLDQFYSAVNDVRPSFIRIEADEATYNLHILLRFELESAIFDGDLQIDDVPATWNERFQKYFGIKPNNNSEGCLQDVHWAAGLIGYFPTYTLGNLYAAQFFSRAKSEMMGLESRFAKGDFKSLLTWLRKNIHQHGQRYLADDLVKRVTGKPLSHVPLIDYLKNKFGEIYEF
jgi:carboxypeptidase Taq